MGQRVEEIPKGISQVKVADLYAVDTGTLNSVRADIYGTPPTSPTLSAVRTNGIYALKIDGNAGRTNLIPGSTDLAAWTTVATSNVLKSTYEFVDPSTNAVARFYRVLVPIVRLMFIPHCQRCTLVQPFA